MRTPARGDSSWESCSHRRGASAGGFFPGGTGRWPVVRGGPPRMLWRDAPAGAALRAGGLRCAQDCFRRAAGNDGRAARSTRRFFPALRGFSRVAQAASLLRPAASRGLFAGGRKPVRMHTKAGQLRRRFSARSARCPGRGGPGRQAGSLCYPGNNLRAAHCGEKSAFARAGGVVKVEA